MRRLGCRRSTRTGLGWRLSQLTQIYSKKGNSEKHRIVHCYNNIEQGLAMVMWHCASQWRLNLNMFQKFARHRPRPERFDIWVCPRIIMCLLALKLLCWRESSCFHVFKGADYGSLTKVALIGISKGVQVNVTSTKRFESMAHSWIGLNK